MRNIYYLCIRIMETTIYIKNMVCRRCIMTVTDIFRKESILPLKVELGMVTLAAPLSPEQFQRIREQLEAVGFEVIDDRRMRMVEQIRLGVIGYVRDPDLQDRQNLSEYLQDKCQKEEIRDLITEIGNVKNRGISIEKYSIQQRIERVKELLFYDELSVSEIADRMHYSSVAHLSAQFKSLTGLSPTQFRRMKEHRLKPLDEI